MVYPGIERKCKGRKQPRRSGAALISVCLATFGFEKPIENVSNKFSKPVVCFVRSICFPEMDRAVAIQSVRKSLKSELSLRFFGRLKIFRSEKISEIQII